MHSSRKQHEMCTRRCVDNSEICPAPGPNAGDFGHSKKHARHRSEGFPRKGYFVPGRDCTGAWQTSRVVCVSACVFLGCIRRKVYPSCTRPYFWEKSVLPLAFSLAFSLCSLRFVLVVRAGETETYIHILKQKRRVRANDESFTGKQTHVSVSLCVIDQYCWAWMFFIKTSKLQFLFIESAV